MGESAEEGSRGASTAGIVLGLATLYVVWGSTYLAIRVAVETMPPFLMAGVRFLIAGTILYAWARLRGAPRPLGVHWRVAFVAGGLLFLGGNGGVVWAETVVPSGLAALLITSTPLWMALFDWLRPGGRRPPLSVWCGLLAGFVGTAVLALVGKGVGGDPISPLGVVACVSASMAWALGSILSKHSPRPNSPAMTTAIQMLGGGLLLLVAGLVRGEFTGFRLDDVSAKSYGGFVYLLILGSLLSMTVYTWLLHHTEPTLIATYSFVNPVIAVLLGWLLADEALSNSTLAAGGVIVLAVAWLIAVQWRHAVRNRPAPRRRRRGATSAETL